MRLILSIALMLCCGVALSNETYRFPRGVVTVGDTIAKDDHAGNVIGPAEVRNVITLNSARQSF